jgi:hypothetical protein
MLGPRLKPAIEALFSAGLIEIHITRCLSHDRRAEKPLDQSKAEVLPRQHSARCPNVAVVNHHAIGFSEDVRKLRSELIRECPVSRGLSSSEQAGPGKNKDAAADSRENSALAVLAPKPGDQRAGV